MMKALVTGSSGFLGRHVARHLQETGWEVTGFDRLPAVGADFECVIGDLTDFDAVSSALDGCDVVMHIGAIGDVYVAGDRPALAASANVLGTAVVLDAASRHASRVVYASTWEVYGEPQYEPIDENHPTRPDHPYNITKLAGDSLVLAAHRLKGTSAIALRLGTAYGSGLRSNSVFRIFIDRAHKGELITIEGDGSQGRQFVHASDIARAFDLAGRSNESGIALNVVAPESVSIRELAERVVSRFQTELTFGPPRLGDVAPAMVSAERARDILGWEAQVAFADGLDDLIEEVIRAKDS